MQLRYITCSGANEKNSISKIIDLANQSKIVEIGIVANSNNMGKGTPKYDWFEELLHTDAATGMNLSLHIGGDWCIDLCNGKVATEIKQWLNMKDKKTNLPLIQRWQLNISNHMNLPKTDAVKKLIKENEANEFIFSLNRGPIVMNFLKQLYKSGEPFSLLYDSSYGSGRQPQRWEEPYFAGRSHGYSGGISSENVYDNLNRISYVIPHTYATWIDAEYNLKTPETTNFDTERAKKYISQALMWARQHTK